MSRSYKKTPIVKDNQRGRKLVKRQSSKKARKSDVLINGNHYRKVFDSYKIYDYAFYCSLKEYDPINDEEIHDWKKIYYLK
jgi:hypothetical protein